MSIDSCPSDGERPVPCPDVTACSLDDELVLCDIRDGQVYVLNPSGARIWSLCDGAHSIVDLAGSMVDSYGIEHRQALTDVREVIASLTEAGLLTLSTGNGIRAD
ncbi:MAG: PqqD family protein [Chloroflexota bacterium]